MAIVSREDLKQDVRYLKQKVNPQERDVIHKKEMLHQRQDMSALKLGLQNSMSTSFHANWKLVFNFFM